MRRKKAADGMSGTEIEEWSASPDAQAGAKAAADNAAGGRDRAAATRRAGRGDAARHERRQKHELDKAAATRREGRGDAALAPTWASVSSDREGSDVPSVPRPLSLLGQTVSPPKGSWRRRAEGG